MSCELAEWRVGGRKVRAGVVGREVSGSFACAQDDGYSEIFALAEDHGKNGGWQSEWK